MATITRENIGLQHDKLIVSLLKDDYLPGFEKALKDYSKKANIPGFRKGMIPTGLIRKMYGSSVLTDEVLRSVDRELNKYMEAEKLEIFAQPLPLELDLQQLNANTPQDYNFSFEVGLKPGFELPDLAKGDFIRYKVQLTEEMIDEEMGRQQTRYGNMVDIDSINNEDNALNLTFIETDANGNEVEGGSRKDQSLLMRQFAENFRSTLTGKKAGDDLTVQLKDAFDEKEREWISGDLGLDKEDPASGEKFFKIVITKVAQLQKKELDEEFFNQLYPGQEIKTEEEYRKKLREEIEGYYGSQANNQIHDQIFHQLLDHSDIKIPEAFLKKWMKTQGGSGAEAQPQKSDEEIEQEFPKFVNQLKWTLISDKIISENNIQVTPEEIRQMAVQQLSGYMGKSTLDVEQGWVKDYVEKMMTDRKYVEDAYQRIQAQKLFVWAEGQVNAKDKEISMEDFTKMLEEHKHQH